MRWLLLCLFFISGACGLIYEIVWNRLLIYVLGGTTFAVTTVLCCFMGGLALGSFLAGRLARRTQRAALWYGAIEIAVGLYCLLVPLLFHLAPAWYLALTRIAGDSFAWQTACRVAVSIALLIAPTCGMGATLPLLTQAMAQRGVSAGVAVARLYGLNTVGAFVGCASAGFVLLPALGLSHTTWIAAAGNIGVGAAAVAFGRRSAPAATPAPAAPAGGQHSSPVPGWLLLLYGCSGLAAMAYQVAWTRALILSLGSSTYAFTTVVVCYILGLALGSLAVSRFIDRIRRPLAVAGAIEVLVAISALVVAPLFGELPPLLASVLQATGQRFAPMLLAQAGVVFALLIVPTGGLGALLPLLVAHTNRQRAPLPAEDAAAAPGSAAREIGALYAANTIGTIAGSAIAGFVLIPWPAVGMQRTILVASALSGLVATGLL
ncbi:MAG: fused MFS/spermidine synthase, partial [Deltaproteobacteria bacterium]|nr:fused MFS/spermidine synthase [Deltaproteobacteria bacterium]